MKHLLLLLPCLLYPWLVCAAPVNQPNIVILLADDLRPDGLGALGNPVVKTPNVDALIKRGFIFRRAYTMGSMVGAVCLPSRAMLLTGQSLFRVNPSSRRNNGAASGVSPGEFTLPRALRAAGYATLHAGKDDNSPNTITREFDETHDPGVASAVADRAIDFIRRKAGARPLLLYLAPHEPHDPQYAPPEFYARYRPEKMPPPGAFVPFHPFDNGAIKIRDEMTLPWPRTKADLARKFARYCASTEYWDAEMGRVIEALRVARQFENTVFIIAGDNGLSLGEHGLLGKQNLYEFGGMHVPLVFSGKGVKRGESKAFAYLMDAFPTICELTGTPIPTRVEGVSLSPVIAGRKKTVRDFCFTAYGKSQRAVCDGRWKLIRYPLIDKTQLFDLNRDAHEERDLARRPELAARIEQLMAKLAELQRQFADPHPLTATNLQPAVWSPAQLTSEDLAAQQKETAITFQLPPYLKAPRRDETGSSP